MAIEGRRDRRRSNYIKKCGKGCNVSYGDQRRKGNTSVRVFLMVSNCSVLMRVHYLKIVAIQFLAWCPGFSLVVSNCSLLTSNLIKLYLSDFHRFQAVPGHDFHFFVINA
jgi:hypothetical protein